MRKLFAFCTLIILTGFSFKAFSQALKYSNEFLSLGIGARAYGMGGAVIASVNDVTAGYWNPAGLQGVKDNIQISLMHNEQFAGIAKHDYGAVAFRLNEKSVLAVSMIRFGVDDIPNTLNLFQNGQIDYSKITNFSAVDYAFIGSYTHQVAVPGLHLGGNVKVVRRIVGDFANAWGFGLDAGATYIRNKWTFAAMFRDVTSTFNAWSYTFSDADKQVLLATNNKLPSNNLEITLPKLILGVTRRFTMFKDRFSIQPEIDADLTFDGQRNVAISSSAVNIDPKIGIELGYKNFIFLRGGNNNFQKQKEIDGSTSVSMVPSIGVGLKLNNLSIDYALADVGDVSALPYSNIISVKLAINKKD